MYFENKNHRNMTTAFFPGSFDPFTVGHKSVVDRIRPLFDRIVIGIGVNAAKQRHQSIEETIHEIGRLFDDDSDISVVSFSSLAVDAAHKAGASVIIKGVRDAADFAYELRQADINRQIGSIETLFVPTLPEHQAISSSIVRELKSYGRDVSEFVP